MKKFKVKFPEDSVKLSNEEFEEMRKEGGLLDDIWYNSDEDCYCAFVQESPYSPTFLKSTVHGSGLRCPITIDEKILAYRTGGKMVIMFNKNHIAKTKKGSPFVIAYTLYVTDGTSYTFVADHIAKKYKGE